MRKLLLGTTAIAAAATLSANAALADVSISGYYEWRYESRSSAVTASDGTKFGSDSEIKFMFTNKTDSGLDISMKQELWSDAGDSTVQESSISITGGFGTIQLGSDDGINDGSIPIAGNDLISEEMYSVTGASVADTDHNLGITSGDMANLAGNDNKIAYYLPAMNGLTIGASFADSGEVGASDTTEFGAGYAMAAGGASINLAYATGTTENATQDIDSSVIGMKVSSGNITGIISQSQYEASGDDEARYWRSLKISSKLMNMSIAAYTSEVEDSLSSEEYSNTGAELIYTVASGLSAIVNVEDYDYKAGTVVVIQLTPAHIQNLQ